MCVCVKFEVQVVAEVAAVHLILVWRRVLGYVMGVVEWQMEVMVKGSDRWSDGWCGVLGDVGRGGVSGMRVEVE